MSLLTRESLLDTTKRRYTKEKLSDGSTVRLRSFSEKERADYEQVLMNRKGTGMVPARLNDAKRRLICLTVVDADGECILNPSDVDKLEAVDGRITGEIYTFAMEHVGLSETDIDGLVGNSDGTPDAASQSA